MVATAPDRKILRKESWFQGVSSCLKSWGEGQATAKGAYEVPHAWTMKQRMEWQEPGPVCNLPRPTLSGLLLPCKPHFLTAPQPPTRAAPDEGQAFKALACVAHFRFKASTAKAKAGPPAAFWHQAP